MSAVPGTAKMMLIFAKFPAVVEIFAFEIFSTVLASPSLKANVPVTRYLFDQGKGAGKGFFATGPMARAEGA